jgi:hypothetical protein
MTIKNRITKKKLTKYYNLTSKALAIAKQAVAKSRKKHAEEIFLMVECYLSDAKHFEKKKDYVNAFGALNYAHGWLDAGARLKIFNVDDNQLFTV